MDSIHSLIQYFTELPGVGPRQAKRFVYFLLSRNGRYLDEMCRLIQELKNTIRTCGECFRFFPNDVRGELVCSICKNKNRDSASLMVVCRDVDFETIEKNHIYNGKYFILGGTVPVLEKTPEKKIRLNELLATVEKRAVSNGLKEIIFAMSVNPEGENTLDFLKQSLTPLAQKYSLTMSALGRGLSTGTELEYSDSDTIKNALKNRVSN
ncbi:recombination protein RecR [Patescibacteria group bacterium]|nr:MAG: recombination protein RecR [Patescibacteria group bacterium]